MSFEFPVSFDQETLRQYREELEYTIQEVEMLAINLERNPEDMATVEQIRDLIQESWMSSVKLDLIPLSESLADSIKGLDILLDWQVFPPAMTEFILGMLDRLKEIALEAEEKQIIDMRKTQVILVALQYIILAKDYSQIKQGVEDAIISINQEIAESTTSSDIEDDVMLFDDGVDLFDDGVDLFGDTEETEISAEITTPDIFVPDASLNPLYNAREFIASQYLNNSSVILGDSFDHAIEHQRSHTHFLAELIIATDIVAGSPIDFETLYKGVCLHDIGMVPIAEEITNGGGLSRDDKEYLMLHPVRSAEVGKVLDIDRESELLILHHHERLDGSGFPFGLKGNNISEQGKLAAIVDSFHGVLEKNGHRSERDQVLRGIVEVNVQAGKYYDPAWVHYFNKIIRDYWLPDWRNEQRQKKAG